MIRVVRLFVVLSLFCSTTSRLQAQSQLLAASDFEPFASFGWAVSNSGDYAIVGAAFDDNSKGSNAGAAYIFRRTASGWVQQKKLLASDGAPGDNFGYAVGLSGNFAIVGAPFEDNGKGTDAGAAYIFRRNANNNWVQVKKLTAGDGAAFDGFGWTAAISGDHAIVGVPFDDNAKGDDAGSAYVFHRSPAGWAQNKKLLANDGAEFDQFGYDVAISGDYAAIGAPYDDPNGEASGAAYIFFRNNTTGWGLQVKRLPGDGRPFDNFGTSVGITEDFAVFGAPYDDNAKGENAGSLYIQRRNGTTWPNESKRIASDGAPFNNFGFSVAINGIYVIGGAMEASGGGKAYVYKRTIVIRNGQPVATWPEHVNVPNTFGGAGDNFGREVSIASTYALVGAPYFGTDDRGQAYIFNHTVANSLLVDESASDDAALTAELDDAPSLSTAEQPRTFALRGNYPNPFNPTTLITFDLPATADVTVDVVDLLGRVVLQLSQPQMAEGAGRHVRVDASSLPSGTYLYRVTARSAAQTWRQTGRMVLIR